MQQRSIKTWACVALGVFASFACTSVANAADDPRQTYYMEKHGVSAEVAAKRLAAVDAGNQIPAEARKVLGDRYAGEWFDNETGEWRIGVTDEADTDDAYGILARANVAGTVVRVDSTMKELKAEQARIARELRPSFAEGQAVQTGIDPSRNAVEVTTSSSASDRAAVRELKGATSRRTTGVRVTYEEAPAKTLAVRPTTCNYPNCDQPLRGGQRISKTSGSCTAGFIMGTGTTRYVLTSGHCFATDPNTWWWANAAGGSGHWIGPRHTSYLGTQGDAGLIEVTQPDWQSVARPRGIVAAWTHDNERPITATAWSSFGTPVCRYGATTMVSCGTVTALNKELNYPAEYAQWNPIGRLTETDACGEPGDSGGPVISGTTGFGIHAASTGCIGAGQRAYYTELGHVHQMFGIMNAPYWG